MVCNFYRFATIFVTALYAMLATMFILVLLVHECWLISLGMTGHEWRNLSVKVCCGLGSSRPYSKGLFRNWLDFFSGNIYVYKEFCNDCNILGYNCKKIQKKKQSKWTFLCPGTLFLSPSYIFSTKHFLEIFKIVPTYFFTSS